MRLIDLFRRKGKLRGTVVLSGLPEHKMLSVTLNLFSVSDASAAVPYRGEPPGSAYTDEVSVRKAEDHPEKPLTFIIERPAGFYYLDVGVIAVREAGGKLYAQVEHFFPVSTATQIIAGGETSVQLSVQWPSIPIDKLHRYGTVFPQSRN